MEKQNKPLKFSRLKVKQRVLKIKEKQNLVYRQYKEVQMYGKKRYHTEKTESNKDSATESFLMLKKF